MKKSLKERILGKLARNVAVYLQQNKIVLSEGATIHKTSKIVNSDINGLVTVGKNATISNAKIHGEVIVGNNVKISGPVGLDGYVEVGDHTSINGPNTDLYSKINKITVGKYCSIARNVSIQEYNHKFNRASSFFFSKNVFNGELKEDIESKGNINIANDVWIGTQCVILSGVHIGNGVVVAANSTVVKDVPDYAIVAGSPAKIIGYRFNEEIIASLLQLKWWDWSLERVKKNKAFFEAEQLTLETFQDIL